MKDGKSLCSSLHIPFEYYLSL
uniref:Uncharacterized protein n=1 Tax=Lepeophtheirus salmonis TaxID=72036 RepID=A0A0K2V6K3_LEPSM